MPNFNTDTPFWYGFRHGTNTPKASGFFGELKVPNSPHKATEYSIDVDMNGKQVQIPTLVPTLNQDQLGGLLQTISQEGQPSDEVVQKAVDHARYRMAMGQSPFWRMPEKQVQPMGLLGGFSYQGE